MESAPVCVCVVACGIVRGISDEDDDDDDDDVWVKVDPPPRDKRKEIAAGRRDDVRKESTQLDNTR